MNHAPIVIDDAVAKVPKKQVVTLKITRADLINQVVMESREKHKAAVAAASKAYRKACADFVAAVNAKVLKVYEPLVKVVEARANCSGSLRADFRFCSSISAPRISGVEETSELSGTVKVPLQDGENYGHKTRLEVELKLTKPLLALREKAILAGYAVGEVQRADTTLATMRSETRDKLIRQSINNSPDGADMLAAIRALTAQLEEESGKSVLEGS